MGSTYKQNQQGFNIVDVIMVLVLLCAVGFAGWYAYSHQSSRPGRGAKTAQQFKSEYFTLSLPRKVDDSFKGSYSLLVRFNDSFDPTSPCPGLQENFKTSVKVSNMDDDSADIATTQSAKPYDRASLKPSGATCDAIAIMPHEDSYTLDKAWLENSQPSKALTIQGKPYTLQLDKQAYKLTLTGNHQATSTTYIPDGVGVLYTESGCNMEMGLKGYALSHGIELAEAKYPGIAQKLQALKTPDKTASPSNESLLIIANDYVKTLFKQKGIRSTCQVHASNTPVASTLDEGIGVD